MCDCFLYLFFFNSLKNKLLPKPISVVSLTICLVVDIEFKNNQIWSRYIQDARDSNLAIHLLVVSLDRSSCSSIPTDFLPNIDPSLLSDFCDASGKHSIVFRRLLASLALLESAFNMYPDSSHFSLVCGDAIPVTSAADAISLLNLNESWMSFPDRIAFTNEKSVKVNWMGNGENGIDTSQFDQACFVRVERFGFLFCNHHLNLLLKINSELGGVKFSQFWSKMKYFYKDDAIYTYYPTALALLGYNNNYNN